MPAAVISRLWVDLQIYFVVALSELSFVLFNQRLTLKIKRKIMRTYKINLHFDPVMIKLYWIF